MISLFFFALLQFQFVGRWGTPITPGLFVDLLGNTYLSEIYQIKN